MLTQLFVITSCISNYTLQNYMRAISIDPLPNTPPHTIIFHYGMGDAQVSWLGCHTIARSAGASMFASNVRWGMPALRVVVDATQVHHGLLSRVGNETLSGFNFYPDDAVVTGTGK
jgi:hypothetical protein